jgi:hypothetical protein
MPEASTKRGRPRKYGSKEEKARQDVIARRARRRLQSTATRDNIRFKIYTTPKVKDKQRLASRQETCPRSLGCFNVHADAASLLQQPDTSSHQPPTLGSTENDFLRESLSIPATRVSLTTPTALCDVVDTQSKSPEHMNVGIVSSSDAPHDAGFVSFDDGDTWDSVNKGLCFGYDEQPRSWLILAMNKDSDY